MEVQLSSEENIIKLRKKRNLSQRQVALAIGVTDQTISNWEQKIHKPKLTPEQTLALCKVLDCSLEELVTGISNLETNSSN